MKKYLIHFLNWMNRKAADEPMSLETDHEDIALMYLSEFSVRQGNCPTCNSLCEIGGKADETRWFIPAQQEPETKEVDINDVIREWNNSDTTLELSEYIEGKYTLKAKL